MLGKQQPLIAETQHRIIGHANNMSSGRVCGQAAEAAHPSKYLTCMLQGKLCETKCTSTNRATQPAPPHQARRLRVCSRKFFRRTAASWRPRDGAGRGGSASGCSADGPAASWLPSSIPIDEVHAEGAPRGGKKKAP